MKLKSLSIIASVALAGSMFLVGCGSSSSGGGKGVIAVDGYIVDLNGTPATALLAKDNSTVNSSLNVGAMGKLTFPKTLTAKDVMTVGANAWIDVDNDGDLNTSIDKQVGFAMRAPGDSKYITPLTTLALALGDDTLLGLVKDFDPVAAASDSASDDNATKNKAQKLLLLGEVTKTVLKSGTAADVAKIDPQIADLNDTNKTIDDVDVSAMIAGLPAGLKTVANKKADSIKEVIKILPDLKGADVDLDAALVGISDGGEDIATAVGDANITDVNTSAADAAISDANSAVEALPAKLSVGSIKIGDKTVVLNGNSFVTTVDTKDKNISDFYNVSFPSVTLTKGFADDAGVGVRVKISDANNNEVTMSIAGATINASEDNTSVGVTLPVGSTITVTQSGLPTLQSIMGTSATANIGTKLVMNDLGFNTTTVLGALDANGATVANAIAALNDFIRTSNVYDVNITFTGVDNVVTDYTSFTGKVTVEGAAVVTPPTPPVVTPATISAADFSGKTVVFHDADGNETTIAFADDMNFTEDQDTGTWAVANNALTLTYSQGGHATVTFAATPAAGVSITGEHVDSDGTKEDISATIVSINDTPSASNGISDPFATSHSIEATNNTGAPVETTIDNLTVKVYASQAPASENSNSTVAIYGTVNGTNTAAALKLNDSYASGTTFVVKVYDTNNDLVAISSSALEWTGQPINFGALAID